MENWYPAVVDYICSHRDEIIADLSTLVRIPSISKAGQDGLPFGKDVDDALNAAAALFEKNGIPMQVRHDGGYAVGGYEGQGSGIGVFGHADVVPVNNDWIKTTPFSPVEENGFLFGRGVGDNKAGVISSLYALLALKAAGVQLKSRITVFVGGSEETGMQDMAAFVKNEGMPAVSLVPDCGFPVSMGEKGIMRVDCRSKLPLQDVKKLDGGKAYNVILDQVDVALANGDTFTVKGLTSHAASPEGSVNAAHKAAAQLLDMPICENDKAILAAMHEILNDNYGEALNITSTGAFGKLTCANGIARVEEDGRLLFTLDIRYGVEADPDTTINNLTITLDKFGFTAQITENDPGFLLDVNGKPMEIILSSCREACDAPDAVPFKSYGGTYARKLRNAYGISHSVPGSDAMPELPAGHGSSHQSDECISIENLLKGIQCMALMIGRLDAYLCQ